MPRASSSGISSLLMPPGAARCSCTIWACLTASALRTYSDHMSSIRLKLTSEGTPPSHTWLDWDPETGAISGPAAFDIRGASITAISNGTLTQFTTATDADLRHRFSKEPLKNYSDMSIIVRHAGYELPDILKPHFPKAPKEQIEQLRSLTALHDPEGTGLSVLL